MKILAAVALLVALLPTLVDARTRPGPVTIRGIASHVSRSGFSMSTNTHGTLQVHTRSQTTVTQKGHRGHVAVANGDHVGVRGFLTGHDMTAMTVRIYPVKPKQYSVKGTVRSVSGTSLTVVVGHTTVTAVITAATTTNVGSAQAALARLKRGQHVEMRLVGTGKPEIVHLHVYAIHAVQRHVTVTGTISAVAPGEVTVNTGHSHVMVSFTRSTTLYLGVQHVTSSSLRPGLHVTVHACCAGQALIATSIHISRPKPPRAQLIRGMVRQILPTGIVVQVGPRTVTCAIRSSTRLTIGSDPMIRSQLKVGQRVSVRGYPSGRTFVAESIHVYVTAPPGQTLSGVVSAVRPGAIVVTTSSGQRWTINAARGATVTRSGHAASIGNIRVGDTVKARGQVGKGAAFSAQTIEVTPKPVQSLNVRGTLVRLSGNSLVVVTSSGARITFSLGKGVRPLLHGAVAPQASIFPGVRVAVRGVLDGGRATATAVTVEAVARRVDGRVIGNWGTWLRILQGTSETIQVDVPGGLRASDGSHRIAVKSIHAGAYLAVNGYVVTTARVHAAALSVEHPTIDVSTTVLTPGSAPVVQTSAGASYTLHAARGASISVSRYALPISLSDIPGGCRVHVTGVVQSDGSVLISALTATLRSAIVEGTVTALGASLAVRGAGGEYVVRLAADASVMQGSRPSSVQAFVLGDSVTVHGYLLMHQVLLTRSIDLHRSLRAFDGTVLSLTADGFVFSVSGKQTRVIVSSGTAFTGGTAVAIGYAVHVTGYVRGDGAIEATRVKIGKG